MGWDLIAQLIITEGIPVAEAIVNKWQTGKVPTASDWQELKDLSQQNALNRMQAALNRAGISVASVQGQELTALVGGPTEVPPKEPEKASP